MVEATADGVSFRSVGLGLVKHNIPVLPPTKDNSLEIAGADGEVDFGSTYGPRVFDLECVLIADDPTLDYHRRVAKMAALFNVKKGDIPFTFSDLPNKRYMGRYAGTMPIDKIIFDGNVTLPIKMHNPWPDSLQDTELREYGEGLEYGQGYFYAGTSYFEIISSGQKVIVENEGSEIGYPLIRITGAFTDLSMSDGKQILTFSGGTISSDVLEIDCDLKKCRVRLNGVNAYSRSNGVFFELNPGETEFTVNATAPNFTIEFIYHYKYLY
ncbi:distal tail protein Dit [Paenibacillus sp. P46E]|uniref:distal tail protein Dit n=1 Tax=Paenibacillus sp. P46E TaxID=1349436 RepID=UPI00093C1E3C|nr:distal tail protein Dit [Paenibacillus sp. P46E]